MFDWFFMSARGGGQILRVRGEGGVSPCYTIIAQLLLFKQTRLSWAATPVRAKRGQSLNFVRVTPVTSSRISQKKRGAAFLRSAVCRFQLGGTHSGEP